MTNRIKHFLPVIVLVLVILALLGWYMMSVPAPVHAPTTPSSPVAATEPVKIADTGAYYTVDATYPRTTALTASAGAQADQTAVATMKAYVEAQIGQFKKDGNFDNLTAEDVKMMRLDERKYALGIEYKTYESPSTISYVYQLFTDTLGAHPNTTYHTFTFNKKTGATLALADIFVAKAPYLQTLSEKSRAVLPGNIARMEEVSVAEVNTDFIYSGTKPEKEAFQNFYFEDHNLVLLFPPYQVGPYVLGMVTLPLPTSELKDLRPEYTQ